MDAFFIASINLLNHLKKCLHCRTNMSTSARFSKITNMATPDGARYIWFGIHTDIPFTAAMHSASVLPYLLKKNIIMYVLEQ